MSEDLGFTLHRRGSHQLAGRTILQVVASLDDAEADRAAIDVAGALAEAGARALVAAPVGHLVSELQAKGGIWLDFPSRTKNPLSMVVNARKLRTLLAREQVDLVHARSRPAGWVTYAATRGRATPFVTSLHQIAPGQSIVKQRYNAVMAKGDMVIAGSNFAAATISSIYPVAAGQIVLIRPGVEFQAFDPAAIEPARVQALRHAWTVAPDDRIILLVARPSVWKGHKVLIEAIRLLRESGFDDLKLVLVGKSKGGAGREIDHAVKAAGIGAAARSIEACPDLPAALLAAAVVVVPSIEPEAFGRVAIEAQAVGTPVVVSDLGAVPETVLAPPDTEPSKRSGWRVTPSDPVLLAEALREALTLGASGRDALAGRARRQVEERFSVKRMVRETLDAYGTLIERHAARGPRLLTGEAKFRAEPMPARGIGHSAPWLLLTLNREDTIFYSGSFRDDEISSPRRRWTDQQSQESTIRRPMKAPPVPQKDGPRTNKEIRVREVQLIDAEGTNRGVTDTLEAMQIAEEAGMDLVEIVPNANPPVCKILDYGKFRFLEQKKSAEARKRQKIVEIKEIKLRPGIDDHDYDTKMKAVRRFFEEGDKVKVTLRFRGREMAHQDIGFRLLERVKLETGPLAKVEAEPSMEGRQMVMVLAPR